MANMINTVLSQLPGKIDSVVAKMNSEYPMIPCMFVTNSCNKINYVKYVVFFHNEEELTKYLEESLDEDGAEYCFHNWIADNVELWPNDVIENIYGQPVPVLDMEVKSEIGKLYRGFNKYNPTVYRTSMYSVGLFQVKTDTDPGDIDLDNLFLIRYFYPKNSSEYIYKVTDGNELNKEDSIVPSKTFKVDFEDKIVL